jgi:hypothetical protein
LIDYKYENISNKNETEIELIKKDVDEMTTAFLSKNFTNYYKYIKIYYEKYVPDTAKKSFNDYTAILDVILP